MVQRSKLSPFFQLFFCLQIFDVSRELKGPAQGLEGDEYLVWLSHIPKAMSTWQRSGMTASTPLVYPVPLTWEGKWFCDSGVYMRERWKMAQHQVGKFIHIRLGWKTTWRPVQEAQDRSRHFLISFTHLRGTWEEDVLSCPEGGGTTGKQRQVERKLKEPNFLTFRSLTLSALQFWILFANQKRGKILVTL